VDIRQLRYFVGVLEARSLSKAAGLLNVAQPALGVQIRNLERELGTQLLQRHARGVFPTEAGQRLAQHATQLLRQFELARKDLIEFARAPHSRVTLHAGRTIPRDIIATIAETCRERYPEVQLALTEGRIRQIAELGSGGDRPDLVLTFRPDAHLLSPSNGLPEDLWTVQSIVQDELYFVSSPSVECADDAVDLRAAFAWPLVLPSASHAIRQMIDVAAEAVGCELNIYCNVDSIESTKKIVMHGSAASFLPLAFVRDELRDGRLRAAKTNDHRLRRTLRILRSTNQRRSSSVDLVHRLISDLLVEATADRSLGWSRAVAGC
jgi:LysR family transcriptional regulator, nitrogen assimilation regulatory protein